MQDQLKEYGLNIAQVLILFTLLIIPQQLGNYIIVLLGVTEVKHYFEIFAVMVGITAIYYGIMMFFHERLINRIYDLVYLKYLIVILILFWILNDGVTAYFMQEAYFILDERIIRRDIVWRDVAFEDLPDYVIYANFKYAYIFCLSVVRFILIIILASALMRERREPRLKKKVIQRQKLRNKSVEELKAGLHPSILKKYQDENKSE